MRPKIDLKRSSQKRGEFYHHHSAISKRVTLLPREGKKLKKNEQGVNFSVSYVPFSPLLINTHVWFGRSKKLSPSKIARIKNDTTPLFHHLLSGQNRANLSGTAPLFLSDPNWQCSWWFIRHMMNVTHDHISLLHRINYTTPSAWVDGRWAGGRCILINWPWPRLMKI